MSAANSGQSFIYEIDGLRSFSYEYQRAERVKWSGTTVAVLPLKRVYDSKKAAGRPKDLAVLPILKRTMALKARARSS